MVSVISLQTHLLVIATRKAGYYMVVCVGWGG